MAREPARYRPPAVARALEAVERLAEAGPMRLSGLAREMGVGKSSLLGGLAALEEAGWVRREGNLYRLGEGLLRVARRAYGPWEVGAVARPFLERLAERWGVTSVLGVPRTDGVRIEECVPGGRGMQVSVRPGAVLPLLAPATGKALLAALPPDRARTLVEDGPLPRFTDRTITEPARFWAEVVGARKQGYAVDDGEYLEGVRAVAAAVTAGSEPAALVWVVGFAAALPREVWDRVGADLRDAADLIGKMLQPRPT